MNGSRSKVRRLLADPKVTTVVVEHRVRLGRVNTELVEAALQACGRRLVVLEDGEVEDDLVGDMRGADLVVYPLVRASVGQEPGAEGS
jgi:putative resolvase